MKTIAILLLLLCAPLLASPGPVDSSASGMYLGTDRVCRIVLSRHSAVWDGQPRQWWVQVDIRCQMFAGAQTSSLTTVYAPNACPQGGAYSLTPWASNEYLSLRSAQSEVLSVVRGTNSAAVSNGIGVAEDWYRIVPVASPVPYSCSGAINGGKG